MLAVTTPSFVELPPLTEIDAPASVDQTATRLDPPVPAVPFTTEYAGRECVGALDLLTAYSPGWNVHRMARIMFRESRCEPWVRNRIAFGLLQVLGSHCRWLAEQTGESWSPARLLDAEENVRAAAVLWQEQGYGAWAL